MFNLLSRSALAGCFTVTVFLLMSYLIKPGEPPPEPDATDVPISILRKERQETSESIKQALPTPPQTQSSPPPLMAHLAPAAALQNPGLTLLAPIGNIGEGLATDFTGDRRAIPLVAITPEYPPRELQNGVEGWVLLEFTIATDGSVENILVIESEPKNAFNRAAIRAMGRWRYQPKMVGGRPVAQQHMREIFRFEIND